jgi:Peptidase M50B-like
MKKDDGIQWDLQPCCDFQEKLFIGLYVAYFVLIYLLWRTELLKPMKLLGVFVHEMGHASAAWLTCGRVKGIEVYNNEAGLAVFSGGCKLIIIPAGYVGGAFWGGAFVALSGNRIGATVAACLIAAALIVSLM